MSNKIDSSLKIVVYNKYYLNPSMAVEIKIKFSRMTNARVYNSSFKKNMKYIKSVNIQGEKGGTLI